MKLCQATAVVALLASSPAAASGKSRNDRVVSTLASRVTDTLSSTGATASGFAFGGRVKESMTKRARPNPERRTQEISGTCWDESDELFRGDASDELIAAVDECEIDDDTGSMYCSDNAELEAACASDGGQAIYFDFSFECTDDLGSFLVEYEKFPDCIALSCDEKDIMGTAENWAIIEIEDFYSDMSCRNIVVVAAETAVTTSMGVEEPVEEVDVPEEKAEASATSVACIYPMIMVTTGFNILATLV
eukprot:CAMPEP_0178501656 /NCGR_PEP_ID=MMETSP0696-20121128/17073_1 /TAXON_ID=265572 /ORGANISM="Extubocellulus spinifer, Strain CCMP396" /LENGTH=247 /DNA_ID=CAMNT_0020130633 /DNA_START=63 /DNA_END=806 /DNA_ORIENTATION=+